MFKVIRATFKPLAPTNLGLRVLDVGDSHVNLVQSQTVDDSSNLDSPAVFSAATGTGTAARSSSASRGRGLQRKNLTHK